MRATTIGTLVAAFVGAAMGVLVALFPTFWGGSTTPPSAELPFRPASAPPSVAPEPVAPTAATEDPPEVEPPDPEEVLADVVGTEIEDDGAMEPLPGMDPREPAATALSPTPELITRDSKWCARGLPDRCVRVARFYERGAGVDRNPGRAIKFLRLAVKMYAERCRRRDARSCYALSRLYAVGRGVPQQPDTAEALLERTKELCRSNISAFCDAPDAPDELRQ